MNVKTLKELAARLGEIGVIVIALQAIILAFGGHIPPWPSEANIHEMIDDAIAGHEQRDDTRICADYNGRYVRAALVLRMSPNDPAATLQYTEFSNTIDMIPNCRKAVLP